MKPDSLEGAVFAAGDIAHVVIATGAAEVAVHQFPVQEHHCLGGGVSVLQQALAAQKIVGAGVGVQRQGRGIGVGVVEIRKLTRVPVMNVVGIQHRHLHADLCRGGGGQPVDGLPQFTQSGRQRIPLALTQIVQSSFVRQLHCRGSRLTQCLDALGGIARQGVRLVLLRQIPDGLDFQLCDGLTGSTALFIQRLTGGGQLRCQRLDALLRGGLVVVGGVALGIEHRGHQGFGLVAGGLICRPGFGGVGVLLRLGLLQCLIQRRGVGTVSGDQVGDGGGEVSNCSIDFILRYTGLFKNCLCFCSRANSKFLPKTLFGSRLSVPSVIGGIPMATRIGVRNRVKQSGKLTGVNRLRRFCAIGRNFNQNGKTHRLICISSSAICKI